MRGKREREGEREKRRKRKRESSPINLFYCVTNLIIFSFSLVVKVRRELKRVPPDDGSILTDEILYLTVWYLCACIIQCVLLVGVRVCACTLYISASFRNSQDVAKPCRILAKSEPWRGWGRSTMIP